jgi:mannose-6-phosphate isomerase-like protein (cupin superfamily)
MRRIVVANVQGRSQVVEVGRPPRTRAAEHTPGFEQSVVWATAPTPVIDPAVGPATDPTTALTSILPEPGATRLIVLTLPPDSVYADPGFDPAAAAAEMLDIGPGLAELFEADHPGMHTTPTVDYDVVLEGELCLELTDGEITLGPGDIVVQHGTRHAWRNRTDRPARLLAVLVGAG